MKSKRTLAAALELVAVLLAAGLVFAWGRQAARVERGCRAAGGEYMLLVLPAVYYIGKRTVRDWITDLRELWRECGHG